MSVRVMLTKRSNSSALDPVSVQLVMKLVRAFPTAQSAMVRRDIKISASGTSELLSCQVRRGCSQSFLLDDFSVGKQRTG